MCKLKKSFLWVEVVFKTIVQEILLINEMNQLQEMWCEYDCCVYIKSLDDDSFIFPLLHVDDLQISTKNISETSKSKTFCTVEFNIKDLGEAKKVFGIEILNDKNLGRLWLSWSSYVGNVLKSNMENAKPMYTFSKSV